MRSESAATPPPPPGDDAAVREAQTVRFVPVITRGLQAITRAGSPASRRERTEQRRAKQRLARKQRALGWTIVSVAGEVLVTIGVFFALFAFWQIVWTDFQAGRVAAAADASLEAEPGWVTANAEVRAVRHSEAPPVEAAPALGQVVGKLHIPRFGMDYDRLMVQGTDKKTVLDQIGIGHYPSTQMPGALGNFAVAGHRATFSRPFHEVPTFKPGDAIVVETADVWYVYKMTSHQLVPPTQGDVIYPVPGGSRTEEPTKRIITLTTCHPEWGSKERWIVHGELDYWMYKSEGTPPELTQQPG